MKIRRNQVLGFVLVFTLVFSNVYAQESEQQEFLKAETWAQDKGWKRFQVELFGGWASMNPADLNLRAAYDETYLVNLKDYYTSYYPDLSQGDTMGEFKTVRSSIPFGFRVRYRLSRLISFSLGLKYVSKNQVSDVSAEFQASGGRPHSLQYFFTDYSISAKALIPTLGAHLSFGKSEAVNFEYFLLGGPMFAECGYIIKTDQIYSRYGNVYRMYETAYEASGNSTGLSLETGLRIYAKIMGGLKVYCEGGYAYQKASNLNGPGNFVHYYYLDPNTREVSDNLCWEGYWGVKETEEFPPLPSNEWEKDDERVSDFTLDLSGVFIRVGISFSFSL
jgi:hypothetical protein